MAKLLYQKHASLRIISNNNTVIFVDPYAGKGYGEKADLVLITHEHHDHNDLKKIEQKPDCTVISNVEALIDGKHQEFDVKGIHIQAVEAYNSKHNIEKCVGYIITVDAIIIYVAGDTSKTKQMHEMKDMNIDYAFYPCDGMFNMNITEAAECSKLVGAKHNIPYHKGPIEIFDKKMQDKFDVPGKMFLEENDEIELIKL